MAFVVLVPFRISMDVVGVQFQVLNVCKCLATDIALYSFLISWTF